MYKITEYADRIASEEIEIQEKYEIIKSLSKGFTVPNDIALKLDKEVISLLENEKNSEVDIPEIELRYVRTSTKKFKSKITSSYIAADIFREIMGVDQILLYEQMVVLYLNRANEVIGYYRHSKGGVSGTVVDIRLILLAAIKSLASGMVICHNHPTGNLVPSQQDKMITSKLKAAAKSLDIDVLDHVIVTELSYYSFSDEGLLGIYESEVAGIYSTDEDDKMNYVDEAKVKKFIRLAAKLKF